MIHQGTALLMHKAWRLVVTFLIAMQAQRRKRKSAADARLATREIDLRELLCACFKITVLQPSASRLAARQAVHFPGT
jgi:hypothetical protein